MKGALLGPQRLHPTVKTVVDDLKLPGPVALINAGWQEREDQDEELLALLGPGTVNLKLYERGEHVLAHDREYAALHRKRQEKMRQRQDYYRLRLTHGIDAALDIARLSAGSEYAQDEMKTSLENIRRLDADHLAHCRETRQEFEQRVKPLERDAVVRHRRELEALLAPLHVLVITGGHVAVMLNRLRLFGIAEFLAGKAVVAWSGGAMVTGDRVVLFHESPPQGAGISEVMDEGLGLHHGVVPLPSPRLRLKLDDAVRVGWMARRNAPEKCIAFDEGESVRFENGHWFDARGTQCLQADGSVTPGWTS